MGEQDRFRDKATKTLFSGPDALTRPNDKLVDRLAEGYRDTHNAALGEVACKADHHARFCRYEADNGGSPDLYERANGANYLAEQARNLKVTSHD